MSPVYQTDPAARAHNLAAIDEILRVARARPGAAADQPPDLRRAQHLADLRAGDRDHRARARGRPRRRLRRVPVHRGQHHGERAVSARDAAAARDHPRRSGDAGRRQAARPGDVRADRLLPRGHPDHARQRAGVRCVRRALRRRRGAARRHGRVGVLRAPGGRERPHGARPEPHLQRARGRRGRAARRPRAPALHHRDRHLPHRARAPEPGELRHVPARAAHLRAGRAVLARGGRAEDDRRRRRAARLEGPRPGAHRAAPPTSSSSIPRRCATPRASPSRPATRPASSTS